MKKQYIFAVVLFFILLFSGSFYLTTSRKLEQTPTKRKQDSKKSVASGSRITQKILYSSSEASSSAQVIDILEDETALALIKRTHQTTVKNYSFGSLVDAIDSITNGTDNNYWILYINGKKAIIGAGAYKLQNNDLIEWRFEAYEQ